MLHNIEVEWQICASSNQAIMGSDKGLSPIWRPAIILTNAPLLSIGPWGTNFSPIVFEIQKFD